MSQVAAYIRTHSKAVDGMVSCACSLSISLRFLRLGVSGRNGTRSNVEARVAAEEGSMESRWAMLPEELLLKVLDRSAAGC
jgi:hypothetical protein